jgi:hypothetical protein
MEFYNIRDTFYWGPIYWNVLHNISKKIDEKHSSPFLYTPLKNIFLNIILQNLNNILPCETCKNNYKMSLECALQKWKSMDPQKSFYLQSLVFVLHNCVNKKRGVHTFLFFDTIKKLKPIEIKKFREINQELNFTDEISYIALEGLIRMLYPSSPQEMKML